MRNLSDLELKRIENEETYTIGKCGGEPVAGGLRQGTERDTFCDSRSIECRLAEGCFSIE